MSTSPTTRAKGKGKRVAQACIPCRTGKMRCDGRAPTCSPCGDRGRSCTYPATQKMRGPGKSKQRIEALEARLLAMESRFRQKSGERAGEDDGDDEDDSADDRDADADEDEDYLEHAPSSSRHPESPAPAELPGLASGQPAFDVKQLDERFATWHREVAEITKPFARPTLSPLAADAPEVWLVDQVLDEVCTELPFLSGPWFLDLIKRPDAFHIADAWWQGLANVIIASAVFCKTHNSFFRDVAVYSWSFFRNAFAVLPELIVNGGDLGAAQAVFAMVIFMRQSADTRMTAMLLAMAIRMQHSAGVYVVAAADSTSSPIQAENRNRLYWSAFIFDMDMALNTGLPPSHTLAASLPAMDWLSDESFSTSDLSSERGMRDTVFRLRGELAMIQQRIIAQLTVPTQIDLLPLQSDLETWCLKVPPPIRPDWRADSLLEGHNRKDVMDVSAAVLSLVYLNSLSMVSWISVRNLTEQMMEAQQPVEAIDIRTSHHRTMARVVARASIRLMARFPAQSFVDLWKSLHYPVAGSIALMAVVCKEPTHLEARSDLSLLGWFVRLLDKMVRDDGCDLERLRDGIARFEKVATDAVDVAMAAAMPVNPALWPLSLASGRTGKTIANLLKCDSYHPMYLAQSFMGNTPNRDTENAKELARILGLPWGKNGFGAFVPDLLMPATYGFTFDSAGS